MFRNPLCTSYNLIVRKNFFSPFWNWNFLVEFLLITLLEKGAVLLSLYCCFYYYNYFIIINIIIIVVIIIIIIIISAIIIIIIIIILFVCFARKFVQYRLFFFPCNSRNLPAFKWTKEHDVLLAREMLTVEPYKCKNRSSESGQAWDLVAANLNSVHAPRFRVGQKSVRDRDRARILLKNFKLKIREEEKASGIEVEELSELDLALEEIIEKEKAANAQLDLEESVKKNELQDKANAEEMRLQAMERLGESKKRREASELTAGDQKKKKARRSGSDTLDFMREKMEKDMTMKQEEMAQRRSEQQKMLEQQNNVLQQMQLQQVNQRQHMQDMLSAFIH